MSRKTGWLVGWGLTLLMSVALVFFVPRGTSLLGDSDTRLINTAIEARHDPLSWFVGDWPLNNHFYRPVTTLLFEYDLAAHPRSDDGWSRTDGLLCALATLALFWFLRELTDNPILSILSTGLFYLWTVGQTDQLASFTAYAAGIALLGGLWRHSLNFRRYLPAVLVWAWLGVELALNNDFHVLSDFSFRAIGWIPGRTATSMTIFALAGLAAFARYLRLAPPRKSLADASPFDVPATKSSTQLALKPASALWPVLAIPCELLALGCYEQAVMVPACFGLVAIAWSVRGRKVNWWWGVPFGLALLGYIVLRNVVIPPGRSIYYEWQKRTLFSSLSFLQRYFFLPFWPLRGLQLSLLGGPILLMNAEPWFQIVRVASSFTAMYQARRRWVLCGFGWLASTVAYLPMAFFKDFAHYHYWPMAMRSIGIVCLGWVAWDLTVIALSRPAVQAPLRLSPAPGSLPRP